MSKYRIKCDNCRGRGWGLVSYVDGRGAHLEREVDCERCDAVGTVRFSPPADAWYRRNGWPADVRKRRRNHRIYARALVGAGTFLNPGRAPRGSIPHAVAQWHLRCARFLR